MFSAAAALVLLKGLVTIGPITPVCRVGVPCDKPAARVVLTFTGTRTVRVTTGAGGVYSVKLRPGLYVVTASKGMSVKPSSVTVGAGRSRRVNFAIDTGIR